MKFQTRPFLTRSEKRLKTIKVNNLKRAIVRKIRYSYWTLIVCLFTFNALVAYANTLKKEFPVDEPKNAVIAIKREIWASQITDEQTKVLKMVEEAGLNPYEAYMIIKCESNWNPNAVNYQTNDFGLWQIHFPLHSKTITPQEAFDPIKSTEWAIAKRLNDGNWSAWVCAKNLNI